MKFSKKMRFAVLTVTALGMSPGLFATEIPELPQDSLTLQEVVVAGSRSSVNINNLP
ncbi:MAG: hypothetical protein LUE93_17330 [Bacteroides sp.]|nr:hypothetical protein [Bacteroides sp.]